MILMYIEITVNGWVNVDVHWNCAKNRLFSPFSVNDCYSGFTPVAKISIRKKITELYRIDVGPIVIRFPLIRFK